MADEPEMATTTGVFYVVPGGRQSKGTLHLREDGSYRLHVASLIRDSSRITRQDDSVRIEFDTARAAAEATPLVIHGLLDDEAHTEITLLDASMTVVWSSEGQQFVGSRRLIGTHITADQPIHGARWTMRILGVGWLEDAPVPITIAGDGRTLRSWDQDGWPGLEITSPEPMDLWSVEMDIQPAVTAMLELWLNQTLPVVRHQLQISAGGPWFEYVSSSFETGNRITSDLLPQSQISLERLATWAPLADTLGPILHIASLHNPTLQLFATVIATGLEGLHRRLRPKAPGWFTRPETPLNDAAWKRVRHAVVKGTRTHLATEGWPEAEMDQADQRISTALRHLNQPTYDDRLNELIGPITQLAPGLLGPDPQAWINDMKTLRNNESHQLPKGRQTVNRLRKHDTDRYFTLAVTGQWVMKLSILRELCTDEELATALRSSTGFQIDLGNMDAEPYWSNWSSLSTFRSSITNPGQTERP